MESDEGVEWMWQTALSVWKANEEKPSWCETVLYEILSHAKVTPETLMGWRDPAPDKSIYKDLESYTDNAGYDSIVADVARNEWYRRQVQAVSDMLRRDDARRILRWIDIGAGDEALLTMYVLKASRRNHVVSIEANEVSAFSSLTKVRRYVGAKKPRVTVLCGKAGDPTAQDPDTLDTVRFPVACYDVCVVEMFGPLVSSEGLIHAVKRLGELEGVGQHVHAFIPSRVCTMMVPVDLLSCPIVISCVQSKVLLCDALPIDSMQLSPVHHAMETYDLLEELKTPRRGMRTTTCTWVIGDERSFHGFASYILFSGETGEQSSNASIEGSCTNWPNAFFPVGGGEWTVRPNDTIICSTEIDVDSNPEASYVLTTRLVRDGVEVGIDCLRFDYHDILCRSDTFHEAKLLIP